MTNDFADVVQAMEAKAAELREQLETLEQAIAVLKKASGPHGNTLPRVLPTAKQTGTAGIVNIAHRIHLSAARAASDDRLAAAANEATPPQSVNSLAKIVDCSPTLLRLAHKGDRSISLSLAEKVRDVLGKDADGRWRFDATAKNWPKIRSRS